MAKSNGGAQWLLVGGCICDRLIAPYVEIIREDTGLPVASIYRGSDARAALHRHGLRTQAEIHRDMPSISNPEGESMHDLHSDGVAKPGPVGRRLQAWEVGVDMGPNDEHSKRVIEAAARARHWVIYHPYSRGVEGHHWGFKKQPRPMGPRTMARVLYLRRSLPAA
jgi:hypothetical protein